jgi:hypothetical protein
MSVGMVDKLHKRRQSRQAQDTDKGMWVIKERQSAGVVMGAAQGVYGGQP